MTTETLHVPERALYPVKEARHLLGGLSQAGFYNFAKAQQIQLVRLGRRTFVPSAEIARIAKDGI